VGAFLAGSGRVGAAAGTGVPLPPFGRRWSA